MSAYRNTVLNSSSQKLWVDPEFWNLSFSDEFLGEYPEFLDLSRELTGTDGDEITEIWNLWKSIKILWKNIEKMKDEIFSKDLMEKYDNEYKEIKKIIEKLKTLWREDYEYFLTEEDFKLWEINTEIDKLINKNANEMISSLVRKYEKEIWETFNW